MPRTSEIEAVNTMLGTMSFQSVSTLVGSLRVEVAQAVGILEEIRRDVLSDGWNFNSETKVIYTPSGTDGRIQITEDILHIDTTRGYHSALNVVQRGSYLYEASKHTFVFDGDLTCDTVVLLDWSELPEVCRRYIMIRAARTFVDRNEGTATQSAFSTADERRAEVSLLKHNAKSRDHNYLKNSSIRSRRSVIDRIQ